ncbi:MAG: M24 family metallopeptidase, partial [Eubacteriales bacterium]
MEELRRNGYHVPNPHLIKTPEQIEKIRDAGHINTLVLDAVEKEICIGMTTEDINIIVDRETRALGGIPAPLGFEGFPKSVCTSVNDVVCHGIPSEHVRLCDGDIVNVDCTTDYGGYFGDASRMFCLGNTSPEARQLVDVTKQSIHKALARLAPYS